MRPPNFLGHKIEHEIAMNPFPRVIFFLENHTIKDLYEVLYKIFMISMKYNAIISYAKSTMREKKGETESSFIRYERQ